MLTLTREESTAHTLFTEPRRVLGEVPTRSSSCARDFMISFRFTRCDRAWRPNHDAHKLVLRSSLGDLHCARVSLAKMTTTGFEPVQLALVELESTPLDHSGRSS